jgi:5-bromo-4-chloroindolyl phosphate hydrolysis protein
LRGNWFKSLQIYTTMEEQQAFTFIQVLLIAAIPSLITGIIAYLVFHQQLMAYKRDTMAERAAKHFLKHKGYTDRSFETLKSNLGGWDHDQDELRRILVRAGAIRTFRNEKDGTKKEWWTLLSRIPEKLEKRNIGI